MVNPFREFRAYQARPRPLPLDRIIATRDTILEQLVSGYEQCTAQTPLDWERMPDLSVVERAYTVIAQYVAGLESLDYTEEDIEDFCFSLEQMQQQVQRRTNSQTQKQLEEESPGLWALSGLYVSALCNHVSAAEIVLPFTWLPARVHLIGYKLATGKRLRIDGHCGDLLGAGLDGGEICVQGSARDWLGCGLRHGKITITGTSGEETGAGMQAGEIHVLDGRIRSVGQVSGGRVYLGERLVAPVQSEGGSI
jgi:hypothetical protein